MIYFRILREIRCDECDGQGEAVLTVDEEATRVTCSDCNGEGLIMDEENLSAKDLVDFIKEELNK